MRRELRDLELARFEKLLAGQLRQVELRRAELDASDAGDRYILRLLEEDEERIGNARQELSARRQLLGAIDRAIRSHLADDHASANACVDAACGVAVERLKLSRLENKLLGLMESIRWEEGDSDDGEEGVTPREARARAKLGELRKKEKVRRTTLAASKDALKKLERVHEAACAGGK